MRNPNPYCERNDGIIKGAWSKQEDQKLIDYVRAHGEGCWRSLPEAAGLQRCGKSCRLRWINYLRPDIKRGNFAQDEEDLIIKLHALLGNRWSLIAGRLPGRTDNEVKNFWNSHLKKKLIKMGIDPNNHRLNQTPQRHSPINNISSQKIKQYQPKTQPLGDHSRVSDMGSCLEHESTSAHQSATDSSNLNLDLSIAVPSADDSITTLEVQKPQISNGMDTGHNNDIESDPLPTLILFR